MKNVKVTKETIQDFELNTNHLIIALDKGNYFATIEVHDDFYQLWNKYGDDESDIDITDLIKDNQLDECELLLIDKSSF